MFPCCFPARVHTLTRLVHCPWPEGHSIGAHPKAKVNSNRGCSSGSELLCVWAAQEHDPHAGRGEGVPPFAASTPPPPPPQQAPFDRSPLKV